jgi:hypothetical protein
VRCYCVLVPRGSLEFFVGIMSRDSWTACGRCVVIIRTVHTSVHTSHLAVKGSRACRRQSTTVKGLPEENVRCFERHYELSQRKPALFAFCSYEVSNPCWGISSHERSYSVPAEKFRDSFLNGPKVGGRGGELGGLKNTNCLVDKRKRKAKKFHKKKTYFTVVAI